MFSISKITISKKEFIFLISIFILAFNLRVLYLKDYENIRFYYPVLEGSDSYYYLNWAKSIVEKDFIGKKVFMQWPLYAYFLASLLKLFDFNLIYIYFFQFFLGSLNCILIYFICKNIFNKLVGFTATILYLCYGLFIFYEGLLLYSGLSAFLNSLLFLYFLYLRENLNKKTLFLIGIFLGICSITQAHIIIFGIIAVIFILLEKKLKFKKFTYNFIVFSIGLAIVLGLVSFRNYFVAKDRVLISAQLGLNFYLGNNPNNPKGLFYFPFYITPNSEAMFRDAKVLAKLEAGRDLKPSEVSNFYFKKALRFIVNNPYTYLKIIANKLFFIFSPKEYIHEWEFFGIKDKIELFKYLALDLKFLIAFFYLGLLFGLKNIRNNYLIYLALFSLSFGIILFFVSSRYRISIVPFMIVFASFGIYKSLALLFKKRYFGFLSILLLAISMNVIFDRKETNSKTFEFISKLEKAIYYKDKRNYISALKELEVISNSDNPLVLHTLGELYYKLNNFEKSEEFFKKIILKYPFFVDAYYNLGFLYNQQRKYLEAKEILIKAISLDPEDIPAHFELAKAYKNLGEITKAKEEFWFVLNNYDLKDREEREKIEKEFLSLIGR
ncbi:MAG: glycosyltransferase family 39 protein [Candidatus Omnitrophica bacterium]|nr:glycosyltransferase family 39 protein [Candidatus Omnitrophota bacterium]